MAAVAAFMKANPALYPLAAAMILGVGGGVAFGVHYLVNSPDVVVNKRATRDPWNRIQQHQNSKLFSWNNDFWKDRITTSEPRLAFLQEIQHKPAAKRTSVEKSALKRASEAGVLDGADK
ncbi:MAG: hypothetical protein CYPHOPRED_001754 [Cyphobasidiales sp. Tagirdzhanova-0007]|nr:MAG: hypothetical protein CYPHOPRED_001754 [Cyphobasidiales sp. Tagirdzhanova-0007]